MKIELGKNLFKIGTGFFCQIQNKDIKMFLTNNHLINNDVLSTAKQIEVEINGIMSIIKLDIPRFKYTNEIYDFTIIEIIKEDNINNFLFIDENYLIDNYINEQIFSIHFPKGKDLMISFGRIIKYENFELFYSFSTDNGSFGCPLTLLNNLNVIGIHTGFHKNDKYNLGISMMKVIQESDIINKSLGNFHSIKYVNNDEFKIPISSIEKNSYFFIKIKIKNNGNLNFDNKIILKSDNSKEFQIFEIINSKYFKINEELEINTKINILDYQKIKNNNDKHIIPLRIISENENIKNDIFNINIIFLKPEIKIKNNLCIPGNFLVLIKKILEKEFYLNSDEEKIEEIIENKKLYKGKFNFNEIYDISLNIWKLLKQINLLFDYKSN